MPQASTLYGVTPFCLYEIVPNKTPDSGPALLPQRKQAVVARLDRGIAVARGSFESLPVEHGDLASRIADQPRPCQGFGGDGYARAAHGEHDRQKLLSQRKHIRLDAIVRDEQPSRATRLHGMNAVAGDG